MAKAGAEMVKRLRDYAVAEPGYTVAFAAWDLGVSIGSVQNANAELLSREIVHEIEPRKGPYGAVYQYKPIPADKPMTRRRRLFAELDESRVGVGAQAPGRGVPVAHTGGAIGPSGKPGLDRKRGKQGFKVKRERQGT